MSPESRAAGANPEIIEAAQRWVVRRDRGLSLAEEAELSAWLAADPRHAEALERSSTIWSAIDGRGGAVVVPFTKRASTRRIVAALAAAACLAVAAVGWWRVAHQDSEVAVAESTEARMTKLSDGTLVFLKPGTELTEGFTQTERRVLLLRGEAHFEVYKNAAWPFVVRAGSVEVRAVGTAFNVQMQKAGVEVRVTEGRVRVAADQDDATPRSVSAETPLVEAGQRAVVVHNATNAPSTLLVSQMDATEVQRTLSWQEPLLRLRGLTLAQLAVQFEARTGKRLVLADPELEKIQVGGALREDNLDGLVWVLESTYGLRAERTPAGDIVLRKGAAAPR